MYRLREKSLTEWLDGSPRKPLLLRGARQVGKSTLVKEFARKRGLKLFEINLETNRQLARLFASFQVKKIIPELEALSDRGPLLSENTLLFLDEIQAIPEAIQCLRYFYEEYPKLPVIAAGSLVEFALTTNQISVPVGRIGYLYMGPMSFQEFLLATQRDALLERLKGYNLGDYFPEATHSQAIEALREYFIVGGMPESVSVFATHRQFQYCKAVQAHLIQTYKDDFSKYARQADLSDLVRVFNQLSLNIGNKIKFSTIDSVLRAAKVRAFLDLFSKAQLITYATHSQGSGLPLDASEDPKVQKFFLVDVGLVANLRSISNLPEAELLSLRFVNEGKLAEQFIAQHLAYSKASFEPPTLNYWLNEGKSNNAEVDFLIEHYGQIVPIEVKSGAVGRMRSLFQFVLNKKTAVALRFDTNIPSIIEAHHKIATPEAADVQVKVLSLPLYLVEESRRLLKAVS